MSLATLKQLGLANAASYALARATARVRWAEWHRAHVVAVPRSGMPAMPRGFAVRSLDAVELARHTIDITVDQQAERFAQGIDCLAAFNANGDLTGVIWLCAHGCSEGDILLHTTPPPGAAWDTGMWIRPDHRMGRTFQALWAAVGEWLGERGLTWTISAIADYNVASMGAHARMGLIIIGRMGGLRLGRWQYVWVKDGPAGLVRPPQRVRWQVPPLPAAPASQPPSLAA
jgi:hypothetical protein